MKANSIIVSVFFIISISLFYGCEKEVNISDSEIPSEIVDYVNTHFMGIKILQATQEKEGIFKKYEIYLEGGIFLEFNRKKEIIEIESSNKLPDSVIPEKIRQYVADKFAENFITDWKKERNEQKVELDNESEIIFTKDGAFLRFD